MSNSGSSRRSGAMRSATSSCAPASATSIATVGRPRGGRTSRAVLPPEAVGRDRPPLVQHAVRVLPRPRQRARQETGAGRPRRRVTVAARSVRRSRRAAEGMHPPWPARRRATSGIPAASPGDQQARGEAWPRARRAARRRTAPQRVEQAADERERLAVLLADPVGARRGSRRTGRRRRGRRSGGAGRSTTVRMPGRSARSASSSVSAVSSRSSSTSSRSISAVRIALGGGGDDGVRGGAELLVAQVEAREDDGFAVEALRDVDVRVDHVR